MKNLFALFFVVFLTPAALFPQSASSDIYDLGTQKIRIPAPDGFSDITSQFASIAARFRATEDPNNDMLAIHVPESFIPKLKIAENIDLEFYTKVSVNRSVRSMDITPEIYAAVVSNLEKNFATYLDPNGTLMKGVEKNSEKGLTQLRGDETSVSINSTKNLGFIEKSDKIFTGMMLMSFEIYGRKMTTLATVSIVHVNRRIVFVYTHKMLPGDNDIRTLTDFTKKWTAKIVAANK